MNFLGDDIKINEMNDLQINPGSGDLSTAEGIECLCQDIIEEFKFSYLDDPDHPDRGNKIIRHLNADMKNKLVLIELKQEAKRVVSRDPRVKEKSVKIQITTGDESLISISFETIKGNKIENLVVPLPQQG